VPDEGTYARCRKCENVFFVRKRSREEISILRKSVRERKGAEATIFAGNETPRLPESVIEAAEDSIKREEGQFLARTQALAVEAEPAQETSVDELEGAGESQTEGNDSGVGLAAYSPEPVETGQVPGAVPLSEAATLSSENGSGDMGQTPATAGLENVEEPPLYFSMDDVETLLAAHSPAKRTKADEPLSMPIQNQIADSLSQDAPKLDVPTPVSEPAPAQAAPAKVESSAISQDDIEALLSANAPKPVAQAEPTKVESSAISQDDIEALMAANSPKPVAQAAPTKVESSAISQDDIEALMAANSPKPVAQAEPTKVESSAISQDDIEALMAANAPKPVAQAAPAKVESSAISQDDIEALMAANSPKPVAQAEPTKVESSAISQDDIEALMAANAPKPVAQAEPTKVESSAISQDDIEALMAANSPKPVAQAAPAKVESSAISQDDIEALMAANAPKPVAQAEPTKVESSAISQDDIEALMAANAPKPVVQATPTKVESSAISQDDIEALLSANSPKPAPTAAPSLSQEDVTTGFDQANIDSLFAANAPAREKAQASPTISTGQDDIDALLAANSPSAQSSMQVAQDGQSEIDALLASAMGKPAPKPAAPPKDDGEIMSQSDLDSLLSQSVQSGEAGEPSESKEDVGTISELEIDSILDAAGIPAQERVEEPPEGIEIGDGLLSQDTLDSLLTEASQEEAGAPDTTKAQATGEASDDELEKLLSGEEDSLGEALFQEGSKAPTSPTGEPSLDEMLADELTPRPPARSGDDDHEHAGAMQGVFAQGDVSLTPIEEETGEQEAHVKKKGFNPLSIFAPVIAILKKALGIIPLPKFKFIGAIFQKLPPRLAGVMSGLALAVVVGAIGGGWWLLKGEQAKDKTEVAQKETDHKPALKPEDHPATPVPAKAPAEGHVAPPALAPKPSEVFAKTAPSGKHPVSLVVYLPVEFDAETTKILNMNVELLFESEAIAKVVREKPFFTAVTVEKEIDSFFRDKFYEETVFAQDKLEEFLAKNLKTAKQFAGLKDVRLSAFSID
jgi:hypothetical protein